MSNSYDDSSVYRTWDTYTSSLTTQIATDPASPASTHTFTTIQTRTSTINEGGFALSTETRTSTGLWTSVGTAYPGTTWTDIWSVPLVSTESVTVTGAPNCSLPSSVSQCQASWETFASDRLLTIDVPLPSCFEDTTVGACATSWNNYWSSYRSSDNPSYQSKLWINSPLCSQASLGTSLCNALRSSYAASGYDLYNQPVTNRIVGTDYTWTATDFPNYNSWENVAGYSVRVAQTDAYTISPLSSFWPSASSLAPGCSLGCGGCAITGGTIDLLYWPSTIDTATDTNSNDEVVVTAFGTELTYPTVYVSFSDLYAADSCSRVGSSYSSTIIPVTALDQLSSVWVDGDGLGALTASFNLTDLKTPVPLSIYSRQPWCAVYSSDWYSTQPVDCVAGNATDSSECTPVCPQTRPYEPILVLPSGVLQSLDPAWASCSLDLRGNYDPPYLLTPYAAAAAPTASPVFSAAPTAMPASAPSLGAPSATAPAPETSAEPGAAPYPPAAKPTADSGRQGGDGGGTDPGAAVPSYGGGSSGSSDPESYPNGGGGTGGGRGGSGVDPNPDPSSKTDSAASAVASNALGVLGYSGGVTGSPSGSGPTPNRGSGGAANGDPGIAISANSGSSGGSPENGEGGGKPGSEGLGSGDASNRDPQSVQIGGHPVHADPAGPGVVIGSETLPPGSVATIGGISIAVDNDGTVVAGGSTIALPRSGMGGLSPTASGSSSSSGAQQAVMPAAVITIGGNAYTAQSGRPAIIGSATLVPGGPAATISGETVSMASTGVVVNGNIITYSNNPALSEPSAVLIVGSQTYTVHSGSPLTIGSITLSAGGPVATISGETISLASDGIIVDGNLTPYTTPASLIGVSEIAAPFTISGTEYTAYALPSHPGTEILVGPDGLLTTLSVGGPAITVNGQPVSAVSNGVDVGTSFDQFRIFVASVETEVVFTATDGQVFTAIEEPNPHGMGEVVLVEDAGTTATITVGGADIMLEGETLSAAGAGLVVDGKTKTWGRVTLGPRETVVSVPSQAVETASSATARGGGIGSAATGSPGTSRASERYGGRYAWCLAFCAALGLELF